MDTMMIALQRRLIAAVVLAVCGWLGLKSAEAQTWAQDITMAFVTFLPMLGLVWSYFKKIDREHISRRLVAGMMPLTYAVLGALNLGLSDAERAGFSEGLQNLLNAIVGSPPPELLAAMGLAGTAAVSSYFIPNRTHKSINP